MWKIGSTHIGLIITNGHNISIESNSVDVILCNHVLHRINSQSEFIMELFLISYNEIKNNHMTHLDDMLREIVRILKRSGVLICQRA
jgi:ubiquinone/menaquinone biosynthesis C-methylase UbiE